MWLEFDAAIERSRDEMNRDITHAWRTIVFFLQAWDGKMPNLNDVLIGIKAQTPRRQTGKQVASVLHAMADRYGLTVTKEPRQKHVH